MKIGFIGAGNMAKAMIGGIIRNNIFKGDQIIVSDASSIALEVANNELGVNKEVAKNSEIIVLSVKPQYYKEVIKEIKDCVTKKQVIITIAPGQTLEYLQELFEKDLKIVRTMPNTPALVGEGMTGVCANNNITSEELDYICGILRGFGKVEVIGEQLMDVVVAISGSSPAYVFILIEAMADAAVSDGMPRAAAYQFAAQAVLGSAKMVLDTNKHPGELKDMVCSPGGTTIEAVRILEKNGFRSAMIESMKACTNKAKVIYHKNK